MNPMMGIGPIIFFISYFGLIVYFFYLLSKIARSVQRIADRLDQIEEKK